MHMEMRTSILRLPGDKKPKPLSGGKIRHSFLSHICFVLKNSVFHDYYKKLIFLSDDHRPSIVLYSTHEVTGIIQKCKGKVILEVI
jgi:hypothetical protein